MRVVYGLGVDNIMSAHVVENSAIVNLAVARKTGIAELLYKVSTSAMNVVHTGILPVWLVDD